MDFRAAAEQYAERLAEEKRKIAESGLRDYRFDKAKELSVPELEERMRRCAERAERIAVVSAKARSGSSADITVEHLPGHPAAGMRRRCVTWRKNNSKNACEGGSIVQDILLSEDLLPVVMWSTDPPGACKPIVDAIQGAVARRLSAAFREIGKDELESKKIENAENAKRARISGFKSLLRDSVRGLTREGIGMEDVQAAVNEVLVAIVHES